VSGTLYEGTEEKRGALGRLLPDRGQGKAKLIEGKQDKSQEKRASIITGIKKKTKRAMVWKPRSDWEVDQSATKEGLLGTLRMKKTRHAIQLWGKKAAGKRCRD